MSSILNSKASNDRKYFIQVKTEYKLLEKKYLTRVEELKKWENRAILAKKNNMNKLKNEAESQTEIIRNSITHLINQLIELKTETGRALKSFNESTDQLSIDPDKLLKDMERLIGDSSSMDLDKNINSLKAEKELNDLKNKIQGD